MNSNCCFSFRGLHFVPVAKRFNLRSMRKQRLLVIVFSLNNVSCWCVHFLNVHFISMNHSADWRRNVEMQFSNCSDCKFCSPLGRIQLASAALSSPPCNLVDPASSHMLVSKIKPCMSQYKSFYDETAKGSLKQL